MSAPNKTANTIKAWRQFQNVLGDELGGEFLAARTGLLAACVALDARGGAADISASLRTEVLNPLEHIQSMVTGREVASEVQS